MIDDARIKVSREAKTNPLTGKFVYLDTYEWEGEGNVTALAYSIVVRHLYTDPHFLDGDVITLGGLRLRIVDRYGYGYGYLIVARDGWKARLIKAVWPIKKWGLWVWHRVIWTLAVWELATIEPGMIPSWRDIKGLKWIAKKWGL